MSEEAEKNEARESGNGKSVSKRKRAGLILLVLIVVGGAAGFWMWYRGQVEISTDDAFIEAHIHNISPRVPGHVKSILVDDNQLVRKGDLLVELDPADYQARVDTPRPAWRWPKTRPPATTPGSTPPRRRSARPGPTWRRPTST